MGPFVTPPPNMEPVVIVNDGGGLVNEYEKAAWRYRLEGRRVEIRGSCRSACTLALSVPNVCVGRNAVVKFHHAYNSVTGATRFDVTDRMVSQMPVNIRNEVSGKVQVEYTPEATFNYARLRSLGVPDCDGRSTKIVAPINIAPRLVQNPKPSAKMVNPLVKALQIPLIPVALFTKALAGAVGRK